MALFNILRLKIQYYLPGVFLHTPFPGALNGSLWTIPLEVSWYGAVLVAGLLSLLNFRWVILLAIVGVAFQYFGRESTMAGQAARICRCRRIWLPQACLPCYWLMPPGMGWRRRHCASSRARARPPSLAMAPVSAVKPKTLHG
jgi:hypothetical protein